MSDWVWTAIGIAASIFITAVIVGTVFFLLGAGENSKGNWIEQQCRDFHQFRLGDHVYLCDLKEK